MKVLFNCFIPFGLVHGGQQIQILEMMRALNTIGVHTEPLRWWDEQQTGEILHHWGRPPVSLITFAQSKGMKVVILELLTGQGSRTRTRLRLQRNGMRLLAMMLPGILTTPFNWPSYSTADACIVNTSWEKFLLTYLYGAEPDKVHVLPNGVEEVFLNSAPVERGPWLVCTATITERKRPLELAKAAIIARTPLWVVGKPHTVGDSYAQRLRDLSQQHPSLVRFEGPIQDRTELARIYRQARGFVLLSTMETRSLSAEEAAACGCPLLLSDLPWARSVFGQHATYCPITSSAARTVEHLRRFYESAPALKPPPKPLTWTAAAQVLHDIYRRVLDTSK